MRKKGKTENVNLMDISKTSRAVLSEQGNYNSHFGCEMLNRRHVLSFVH